MIVVQRIYLKVKNIYKKYMEKIVTPINVDNFKNGEKPLNEYFIQSSRIFHTL